MEDEVEGYRERLNSSSIRVTDCISKHACVPIQGVYCYILTPCVEC